mgnify:CR=1 FL=1|jgi:hypothetical protein
MRIELEKKDKKILTQIETINTMEHKFQRRLDYMFKENESLKD